MALVPETAFPGQIKPSTAAWPYGEAQNITTPGDGKGTPWKAILTNDLFGMQQSFLSAAGITPNGQPDSVENPQYLSALVSIIGNNAAYQFATVEDMKNGSIENGEVPTVSFSEGQVISSGRTSWRVTSGVTPTPLLGGLYAEPVGLVYVSDFEASKTGLLSAYSVSDSVVVSESFSASDLTISKKTIFINGASITASGVLTLDAEIVAPNTLVVDTTSVTSYVVDPAELHEIKNKWFSPSGYGQSQTVYGNRAGAALFGKKSLNGTDYNVFHGYRCGEKTEDAIESAFLGTFAGASCTFAHLSTGLGYGALRGEESPPSSGNFSPISATATTAVGQGAFQDGTSHTNSTAVGAGAGKQTGVSVSTTVVGANAARLAGDLDNVTILGSGSGYNLNTGLLASESQYATFVGSNVGFDVSTAFTSTLVGARSGLNSDECVGNTWVGYLTGPDAIAYKDVSSSICIGKAARTRNSNTITIANDTTNAVPGRTLLGSTASQTRCDIAGIYPNTNAAAANMYIGPDSQVYRSTSSLRYKDVIEPMQLEWAYRTLEFQPILYKPKQNAEREDWTYYGYGAEQVAEIDPRFVHMVRDPIGHDEETGEPILADEHKPNGVMYDRIVTAQGMMIKDLLQRIEALEKKQEL